MEIPDHFPPLFHPEGNEFTQERWELGKKLFYDPVLSKDGRVSCASCHDQRLAFADDVAVSLGSASLPGTRNAPTLANVAYQPYLLSEGGVPTLEMQILVPIQEHNEFNHNIVLIADTLQSIKEYVDLAQAAYGEIPSPFVITRAIAQFERSLISGQSAYDQANFMGDTEAMSASAKRGQRLFESQRLACTSCHGGLQFTNYSFQNNGLYEIYDDPGRARLTQISEDLALFKVPSLRNVGLTALYMHDGSISTLEEVIEHYNRGGENHPNKSEKINRLQLTPAEKQDLLSFLHSLTDENFISNDHFKQP